MKEQEQQPNLRIVFMGTPEFAVNSLQQLLDAGYDIPAVVTAADKPAGRGMEIRESAVKKFALTRNLRILQPEKLKDPAFLAALQEIKADIFIVVAFRMLPEAVWNMPRLGTINVHASLLPQYRGAAPINWAIINGETITGVTTFRLRHEIDTGDILLRKEIPILHGDNAGTLHDKLMAAGGELLLQTLKGIQEGTLQETPQEIPSGSSLHHAPKIQTETCKIDWTKNAGEIVNLIRGLSPYPGAFSFLNNKKLKIFSAAVRKGDTAGDPGNIITDNKTFLRFAGNDAWIDILELQLEGRKKMKTEEFLRGYRFEQ